MNSESKAACRQRALYWLEHADDTAEGFATKKLKLDELDKVWSIVNARASLAQAWATLALSAPDE